MNLKLVHSDDRRDLFEVGNGGIWKVCKYLEIKKDCEVGNHYHKNKDELFLLIQGSGQFFVGNYEHIGEAPFSILVPRNTPHVFYLKKDAKLICLASEQHDPTDDYKA